MPIIMTLLMKIEIGKLKNDEYKLVSMLKLWFHSKELKE
jgi:hypothetical protein